MRDQLNALNGITVLAPAEPQRQHINQEVIEVEPVLVQQGTDFFGIPVLIRFSKSSHFDQKWPAPI